MHIYSEGLFGWFKKPLAVNWENFYLDLLKLEDPSEQNELSAAEPARVNELRNILHQWRKDVGAQMPEPNPDYDMEMSWVDYALRSLLDF